MYYLSQQSILAVDPLQKFKYISIPGTVHFFYRCPEHHKRHRLVQADVGFLQNTAAVLGEIIKETPCTCHN